MAKLNLEDFSEEYRKTAPMECACYLESCLSQEEKEKLKENWNKLGGVTVIPFWKYCLEHIDVSYNE